MRSGNGHKYLRYSELSILYDRMDSESLILVYQHIPRTKREDYFAKIGQKIYDCINTRNPLCLSDNRVAFFIMAKTDKLLNKTLKAVDDYAKKVDITHTNV